MGRIYLVRHGQSTAQAEKKMGGIHPFDLTLKGEEQSHAVGFKLVDKNIDFIYTSKVLRARKTTQIIIDHISKPTKTFILNHNLAYVEAFNERDHSVWNDISYDEINELFFTNIHDEWNLTIDSRSPGGESLRDVYNRVIPVFYKKVYKLAKEQNKNILLVSHNRVMQSIMSFLYHDPMESMIGITVQNGVVYDFLI